MTDYFKFISASYLFLIEDGKILLQRRFQTGFEDGNYGVPAGHLDGGETIREGCAREMKEEIGITINPEDLELVHVVHRFQEKGHERFDFFLTAKKYEGEPTNCEPHRCDDLRWFSLDALPPNTIEYTKQAIEQYQKGEFYSEYGWE